MLRPSFVLGIVTVAQDIQLTIPSIQIDHFIRHNKVWRRQTWDILQTKTYLMILLRLDCWSSKSLFCQVVKFFFCRMKYFLAADDNLLPLKAKNLRGNGSLGRSLWQNRQNGKYDTQNNLSIKVWNLLVMRNNTNLVWSTKVLLTRGLATE